MRISTPDFMQSRWFAMINPWIDSFWRIIWHALPNASSILHQSRAVFVKDFWCRSHILLVLFSPESFNVTMVFQVGNVRELKTGMWWELNPDVVGNSAVHCSWWSGPRSANWKKKIIWNEFNKQCQWACRNCRGDRNDWQTTWYVYVVFTSEN